MGIAPDARAVDIFWMRGAWKRARISPPSRSAFVLRQRRAVVKLHWSPKSPYVRKVMIAAHELGLVSRIEKVRSVAAMKIPNPAIMVDNPLSKIPTLVTDTGEAIFGSQTICEYLDAHAGGEKLFPRVGGERWTALTWQALGDGLLDILILWRNEREKSDDRQTPEWLTAFAAKTSATLDRLESIAGELTAATYGIGHISIGCALSYLDFRFDDLRWRDGRPHLARWHAGFSERASSIATEVADG
jgi:glutathione S-transferase